MPWCKKKHRIEFLDDLTDVDTSSPNEGDVLTFVADRWESKPPAGVLPEPGPAGEILVSNGATYVTSRIEEVAPFFVECLTDPAVSGWSQSTAGTGQFGSVPGTPSDHPGQWFLSAGVGSTAPSRTSFYLGVLTGGILTPDPAMVGAFEVMMQVPILSGGGETFHQYIGLIDNAGSDSVSNGSYFYINTSNQLRAQTITGGVIGNDVLVTTILASTWYRLRVAMVGADTVLSWAATSDRNASLATALTAPKVAAPQGPQVKLVRQSGVATREIRMDYMSFFCPKV